MERSASRFDAPAEALSETLVAEALHPWSSLFGDLGMTIRTATAPIRLDDCRHDVATFVHQAATLSREGLGIPCATTRDERNSMPVPVSLGWERWSSNRFFVPSTIRRRWIEAYHAGAPATVTPDGAERVAFYSVRDAMAFLRDRLARFLRARFDGGGPEARPSRARNGMLFEVSTRSSGLRVYYTPMFLLKRQARVLNYPSTPVIGYVTPAEYYFGAAPPGVLPLFDTSASYVVPPDTHAYLPF